MKRGKNVSAQQMKRFGKAVSRVPAPAVAAIHTTADTEAEEDPLFFYMPKARHGEFCQWFPSTFGVSKQRIAELVGRFRNHMEDEDLETIMTFNCAEQFMMYCKAAYFNDGVRQAQILTTDSPREQKALGRLTDGFNEREWSKVKFQVVVEGNMAKFGQNRQIRATLLATGERLLCEAASRDRVWGIGYRAKHAMNSRKNWGENLLGKALMNVRQRLREDHGKP